MSGQDRYGGFREFVLSRGQSLSRVAYLLTGNHQAAEDLLQEALIKTARHWPRVQRGGHPEAYVRKVMLNQMRSWARRRRVVELLTGSLPEQRAGEGDLTDEVAQRAALAAVLARLPARQRAVLYLRYYEDLSEAETARLLRCTVGTVKRHTHDALARIRHLTPPLSEAESQPEAKR